MILLLISFSIIYIIIYYLFLKLLDLFFNCKIYRLSLWTLWTREVCWSTVDRAFIDSGVTRWSLMCVTVASHDISVR
jgi:hypothetical protein